MDKLEKANDYIRLHRETKEKLPVFHVAPLCGWMNDPNGFSVYQDKIHLFYQFHPYSEVWGPMHWGHSISEDFIKWEDMPAALAPDQTYDASGCFSGSGIETNEGHVLVYTGVMQKEEHGKISEYQNQCIAFGNGETYKKAENNPVITGDMLPDNFSREHFRDPKIWKEEDGYYMVIGNKTKDGIPQVVLFHSNDLRTWSYVSVLADAKDKKLGTMWECPDFFCLDENYVLIASPQDMCADEEFHNGNNAVYFLGAYDRNKHVFHYENVYSLDDGLDFYAPQTMLAPDGRRILIAWMQSWDSNIRPADQKWACMMTVPRELSIQNGKILQHPVREIEKYHANEICYENYTINGICQLPSVQGRVLDLLIDINSGNYKDFKISFAQNEDFHTDFTYSRDKGFLEIDRTCCGMNRDTIAIRRVKLKYPKENLKLRLILDRYSAEIFVNDGEQVLSTTFYTPLDADGISFECDGTANVNIQKFSIVLD